MIAQMQVSSAAPRIVYFVHDVGDPAVLRRVRMFHSGGASVTLIGFHRDASPGPVDGVTPLLLGRTEDARLMRRARSVLVAAVSAPRWRSLLATADVIVARQLETLALATLARRLHAPEARLFFECLDIHRQMVRPGIAGWLLRSLEGRLLSQCDGLVVSSAEFVRRHFAPAYRALPPVILLENKMLASEVGVPTPTTGMRDSRAPSGPLWRIGWYGNIRCARSLVFLARLVTANPGLIEVVIRGKVARSVLPDFDDIVAATPGLSFGGPYDRMADLTSLYASVHFAWAIDFFEEGANSDWLLPNRLYEASLFGAIAIASRGVATAAWLEARRVGVVLAPSILASAQAFFLGLTPERYSELAQAVTNLARSDLVYHDRDCRSLVSDLVRTRDRPVARSVDYVGTMRQYSSAADG